MPLMIEQLPEGEGYVLYYMTQPPMWAVSYIHQEIVGHSVDIGLIKAT